MSENENQIVTSDNKKPIKIRRSPWAFIGVLISLIGILILIAAFAYVYVIMSKSIVQLADALRDSEIQLNQQKQALNNLQADVNVAKQASEKSESLSSQIEKITTDLQNGNFNKWYLAEVEYLVSLANDEVQFTHNIPLSLSLLQRADQVMQKINDASLLDLRKAIANNIAALQALPNIDVTTLYTRLAAEDQQVDQLPLPASVLKSNGNSEQPSQNANESWWQQGMNRVWTNLQKIIIVRRINGDHLPFITPDEKIFLSQNLHTQLQMAMWGVLNRNAAVYQLSLTRAMDWVRKYYDQESPVTKAMLQNLNTLLQINIQPPNLNFADTLKLFHVNENNTNAAGTAPAQ